MSKVLVVGARSFIGQHLIRKLIDNGDHVTGLFRKRPDKAEKWMKDVKVASGDITEKSSIAGICKEIEIVYHLAAKVHDFSNKGNTADEHSAVNVSGIKNVLDECINSGIKHFVYFSSVKAMAEERGNNLDETFSPSPETPYGKSKLEAEKAKMKMLGGKEKNFKVRKNLAKEIAKILTLVREKEIIESLQLKSSPAEVSDGQEKKTK